MMKIFIYYLTFMLMIGCSSRQDRITLYNDIGGKETLDKVFGLALNKIYNDPVLSSKFNGVPKKHLREMLTEQTCQLIGGPCVYTGKNMSEAHSEAVVTEAEFYRLVEYVQQAMRQIGLSYQQENLILEKLAPLKAQIVYQQVAN
jgi:hemoglobin